MSSALRGQRELSEDHLLAAMRSDSGAARIGAETFLTLEQMRLPPEAKRFVDEVLPALRKPFQFREAGGHPPQGALFCGPPGTGKTALARALAIAADCSLVSAGGAELAASPTRVRETIAKAVQQKPSILFIDEAEPLLQRRDGFVPNSGAITQFLELTGSSSADLNGVLLIAATNLPDSIDAAALRGGRFARQIWFALPDQQTIETHLSELLAMAPMPNAVDVKALATRFAEDGRSLADIDALVKTARSRAAARAIATGSKALLTEADLME